MFFFSIHSSTSSIHTENCYFIAIGKSRQSKIQNQHTDFKKAQNWVI